MHHSASAYFTLLLNFSQFNSHLVHQFEDVNNIHSTNSDIWEPFILIKVNVCFQ